MKLQPKTEPGLPPDFPPTNPNNTFEQKTIPELVKVLRGTCRFDTFDIVEGVLVSRDMRLREENKQLLYKFQMEVLSRIQAEEDYRKREEQCEKGKRVQESYEDLLKEVKTNGLVHTDTIEKLRKKNDELDCEVKKLKEKCVDDGNKFDVIRRKNAELECEVLELRKVKKKWVEDNNERRALREMICKLEQDVLESKKLKKKWLDDGNVLDELRSKVSQLELENRELTDKKRELEALDKILNRKYIEQCGRVSRVEHILKALNLTSLDGSGGGHNEGEPHADPMVTDFEDNGEEDACDSALGNDTVEEAAPLTRNEAAHQSPEVVAKDGQGASSGEKCWMVYTRKPWNNAFGNDTVDAAPLPRNEDVHQSPEVTASTQPGKDGRGASSARGRVIPENAEIIHLDDDDDDDNDNQPISQGIHRKEAIFGVEVKNEYPTSSSVATQQKRKFANAVDTVKRKFPFTDTNTETSNTASSDDSSSQDKPPIRSVVSKGKQQKM